MPRKGEDLPSRAPRIATRREQTVPVAGLPSDYGALLEAIKVLSRQDRDTLAQFCEARAQVQDIKRLQADPDYRRVVVSIIVDSAGNEKVKGETHPLDAQRRQWTQIARLCASELGLSPTSRARAQVAGQDDSEADRMAEFTEPGIRRVK